VDFLAPRGRFLGIREVKIKIVGNRLGLVWGVLGKFFFVGRVPKDEFGLFLDGVPECIFFWILGFIKIDLIGVCLKRPLKPGFEN
jgi:hypothetical protein